MPPFDGLLSGWQIIDAIGLLEILFGPLRRFAGLPLASLLDEWDAIADTLVSFANDDGLTFACDQDIIFFVNGDAILGENGNGAIVRYFSDAH